MNFGANALYWANTILGKYNIGRIQYWANAILGKCNIGRIQYWANTILGEYNIGRIQYWANTILGECDSPLQLSPRIRRGVSHTPFCIRPITYTQNYIITLLHYYNITCNVFWVGSLVWLSHQNINSLPNNYSQKKFPFPTASLGDGGLDV